MDGPAEAPTPEVIALAASEVAANPPDKIQTELAADISDYVMIGPHRARSLSAGDIWLIKMLVDQLGIKEDLQGVFGSDRDMNLADLDPLGDFLMCLLYIVCHTEPQLLIPVAVNQPKQLVYDAAAWGFQVKVKDVKAALGVLKEYKQTLDVFGGGDDESGGPDDPK